MSKPVEVDLRSLRRDAEADKQVFSYSRHGIEADNLQARVGRIM